MIYDSDDGLLLCRSYLNEPEILDVLYKSRDTKEIIRKRTEAFEGKGIRYDDSTTWTTNEILKSPKWRININISR